MVKADEVEKGKAAAVHAEEGLLNTSKGWQREGENKQQNSCVCPCIAHSM